MRLDQALQRLMPEHSRSRIQGWIKDGLVTIAGETPTAKFKVWGGEQVEITPQAVPESLAFEPEDIPLDVVFEDEHILVINKPAGLVVHPAAGNWSGTLLNALLTISSVTAYPFSFNSSTAVKTVRMFFCW